MAVHLNLERRSRTSRSPGTSRREGLEERECLTSARPTPRRVSCGRKSLRTEAFPVLEALCAIFLKEGAQPAIRLHGCKESFYPKTSQALQRFWQCKGPPPLCLLCLTGDGSTQCSRHLARLERSQGKLSADYQHAEVKRHVQGIVDYLNSDNVLFPNSLILALSSAGRYMARSQAAIMRDGLVVAGTLEIPLPRQGGRKAGFAGS